MQNIKMTGLVVTMLLLLSPNEVKAQSPMAAPIALKDPPKAKVSSSPRMSMLQVAPLFIEGASFSSVLNLVNELKTPLQATVEIYSLSGEQLATKTVRMTPYSLEQLSIGDALTFAGKSSEIGSIRVSSNHTAGLLAALSFVHRGAVTTYLEEELGMPSMEGSSTVQGVADHIAEELSFTAITSISNRTQNVTVTCSPEKGMPRHHTFSLGPNQTLLTVPCSDYTDGRESVYTISEFEQERLKENQNILGGAGIVVTSDAMPNEFAVYGITPHWGKNDVFFTSVNFTDPKIRQGNGSAYVGIPVGPSPLLPEGSYHPEVAISNFGPSTAMITLESAFTSNGNPSTTKFASFPLQSNATRTVSLDRLLASGDLTNSLLVHTNVSPGNVMTKLVSRDSSQIPVELIEKDEQGRENAGAHPWNIEPDVTSTLLLFNHDSKPQKVTLRFGTPTGPWMKRFSLKSMETISISVNELITTKAKDDQGHELLLTAKSGELGWQADSSLVIGRMLQASSTLGMAKNFSCNQYVYACSFYLSPNPSLLMYLNNVGALSEAPEYATYTGFAPPQSCSCQNSTNSSLSLFQGWTSGNNSIATITSGAGNSSSNWQGMGVGSTFASFSGTTFFSGGGSLNCQSSEPTTVNGPDHVMVRSDVSGTGTCTPNCYGSILRNISYQVVYADNTNDNSSVPIVETLSNLSANTCPGIPIGEADPCTNAPYGQFIDQYSTNFTSKISPIPHCGFTLNQTYQWCPASGAVTIAHLPNDAVYSDYVVVNGVKSPPNAMKAGTMIH